MLPAIPTLPLPLPLPLPLLGPLDDVIPDVAQDLAVLYADKLTFGATPALVADIRTKTPVLWLEEQLRPELIVEDVQLEATLATFPTYGYTGYAKREASRSQAGQRELQLTSILRATRSNRQLLEVMTGFWHDHFNVSFSDGTRMWFAADYDRAVRGQALGTFRELLQANAKTAAMMLYLNNNQSRWPKPNENYAREVMELHTLGVDGGYSEDDVKQVSLALTGWGTTSLNHADTLYGFAFHPEWHYSDGSIQVMDLVIDAMSGEDAIAQGEQLLDWLARHPSTARHLSTKLVRRFLGDGDHAALIDRLSEVYVANDTAIVPWLRALVTSQEFLGSRGSKLRRPTEHLVLALRALNPTLLAEGGHTSELNYGLRSLLGRLGHELHTWPTPDGFPDEADYWAASGSVLGRWNGLLDLTRDRIRGAKFDVHRSLRSSLDGGTRAELVDGLVAVLLVRTLPAAERTALLTFVGGDPDAPAGDITDQAFVHLAALVLATPTAQVR